MKGNDIVVPVVRAGENIAKHLRLGRMVPIEVKRLRFDGLPDLLGAGVNLTAGVRNNLAHRRVRLLEGIVASGSTKMAVAAALKNWEVNVAGLDCDAVVMCPVGVELAAQFGMAVGINGEERAVFAGGVLDDDWYVRYSHNDPLLDSFGVADKVNLIGKQVMGDAGDLTSNV